MVLNQTDFKFQGSRFNNLVTKHKNCPVNVYTEWDPLEEVIVGVVDDIRIPEWHSTLDAVIPDHSKDFFRKNQGGRFPNETITKAKEEVEGLASLLESEGIIVRRPREISHHRSFGTPDWIVGGGFYSAMPRDGLLALGNMIIETPMAWRNRYFETFPFRDILTEYFRQGASWISAPKPQLIESSYNQSYDSTTQFFDSAITEFEPLFDAADFIKLGRDIIGQESHVTNRMGIEWLQRLLGDEYRIHIYEFDDTHPMHIDTTILPLAPGKVLVNKTWTSKLPDIFQGWDVFHPPESTLPDNHPLYMTSKWISANILMLDEQRVLVERDETPLLEVFRHWGFEPIPCPFRNFQSLGGSFHCATLDIRRTGEMKNYI